MLLNTKQQRQVELQIAAHKHNKYVTDLELTKGVTLAKFTVFPKVLRPEIMSALQLAQWLYFNNGLYLHKTVIDMGCGSGIQGIVAGLYGASSILFSDISLDAVSNTKQNIKQYRLEAKSKVVLGDLFESIRDKVDLVIFNHPFFSDGPMEEQISIPPENLNRGQLIHRFLDDAKNFLLPSGKIAMPYYHLAGTINDPGVQAIKHGYTIDKRWHMSITTGIQRGLHSIYVLTLKTK